MHIGGGGGGLARCKRVQPPFYFKAFKQYCDTKVTPECKNPKTRIRKHMGGNQGTLRCVVEHPNLGVVESLQHK